MVTNSSRYGHGIVVLECHEPEDAEFSKAEVVTLKNSYPLKILIPEHTGNQICKWIYPIVFGGGLVGGDCIEITIETKPNTCGLLTTQESTKVYHCEGDLHTVQQMNYIVRDNSCLCVLPDYTVCYKDADFTQTQTVHMSDSGNIVLLDWMTCGRTALQEMWDFTSYRNKVEVKVDKEVIYKDCVHLHDVPKLAMKQSMKNYQVMGSCVILGKRLKEMINILYKKYSQPKQYGERENNDVICTVSILHKGGIYLRFLAISTSQAYTVIKEIVDPLLPILGSDPFSNKY